MNRKLMLLALPLLVTSALSAQDKAAAHQKSHTQQPAATKSTTTANAKPAPSAPAAAATDSTHHKKHGHKAAKSTSSTPTSTKGTAPAPGKP